MRILPSSRFVIHLRKLVKKNPRLAPLIDKKLEQFRQNPKNPSLRVHKLTGHMNDTWSFSVTFNIRILYSYEGNTYLLVDIGTHDEVY